MTVDGRRLAIDIVVPLYNEETIAAEFHRRLMGVVTPLRRDHDVRIYYVNDGSVDNTGAELAKLAAGDADVTILELSRNFGHQAALTAGLDAAQGDVVVTLDGDGQHPPELLADMLALYRSGYDVVLTQRVAADLPRFKRWTSKAFYRLLSAISDTRITAGSADYRLLSRSVLEALRGMREYHRFLRGMVAWTGFRTVVLPYVEGRRLGGRPKYSLRGMARLAADATFSFSLVPLRIALVVGLCFLLLAAAVALYVASFWLAGRQHLLVPGWSSLMFMILIVGAALMIAVGLVGIYVGCIFQEVNAVLVGEGGSGGNQHEPERLRAHRAGATRQVRRGALGGLQRDGRRQQEIGTRRRPRLPAPPPPGTEEGVETWIAEGRGDKSQGASRATATHALCLR